MRTFVQLPCGAMYNYKLTECVLVSQLPCSAIYKYALDHLPKSQAGELYRRFVQFEKQQGDREGIEVSWQRCWGWAL